MIQGLTGIKSKEGARRALYRQHSDNQFGKTTTAWLPQYDISPGEENFTWNVRANIDRDRLTIVAIHYWALIMVPLVEPPESLSESPSTPLGFWGWWDDCEWCERWLWRWMTVSGAKSEPQGGQWDLIHPLKYVFWVQEPRSTHLLQLLCHQVQYWCAGFWGEMCKLTAILQC